MSISHRDDDLERGFLATLIVFPQEIPRVVEILGRSDPFTSDSRRKIYAIMMAMWNAGEHIDFVSVAAKMPDEEQRELAECVTREAILPEQVETYGRILVEKHIRRQLDIIGTTTSRDARNVETDVYETVEDVQAKLFRLTEHFHAGSIVSFGSTVDDCVKLVNKGGIERISTGLDKLDAILGGWVSSELTIVAGRPSSGKTAFAIAQARSVAGHQGVGVGIFSIEMSTQALSIRLLAAESGINSQRIRLGLLDKHEKELLADVGKRIKGMPIYIDDTGGIGINELRAKARRMKTELGVGLIVVDYLQLISGDSKKSREQEISGISRMLKATAKELSIPILCLSQLSRLVEQRVGRRPILSDLRESGAIEQDADGVIFVHGENESQDREIIVAKQRNGPLGTVDMRFRTDINRFEEK